MAVAAHRPGRHLIARLALAFGTILTLAIPSPASALTLAEAIERALSRNETVGIAEARVDQARAERRRAIALLLPTVVATGSWTRRTAIFRDIEGSRVEVTPPSAFGASVSGAMRLLDPSAFPLITAASRDTRAQEFASLDLRRQVAFEVADSYLAILAAQAFLDAAEQRVQVAEQAVEVARERLASGLANRNDLTRTELALSEARLLRVDTLQAVELARIALGYLLVEKLDEDLEPVALPPAPQEEAAAAELAEAAREKRPDLLSLEWSTAATRARAAEPYLRILPKLDLLGAWRATDAPGFSGRPEDWNLTLALTWEIYDGGRRYADAMFFRAREQELSLQTSLLARQVDRQIEEALVGLERARVAKEEAILRAEIAAQNAEEIELRFRAGLATALEQADAIAVRFQAEAERAREVLQLELERLGLRNAMGLWPLTEEG